MKSSVTPTPNANPNPENAKNPINNMDDTNGNKEPIT
jgi:hypothetical protein